MREVRLRRRTMEAVFFRRIDIAFAQLLDPQAHSDEGEVQSQVSADDLSLIQHDELEELVATEGMVNKANAEFAEPIQQDRKSTRLNSSHVASSYAVFCLK